MHRFLAVLATVTCRLHGRYRVPGLWKVETTGLWGLRCVGKGTEAGWEAGWSELASHSLPGSATQAAEQSDDTQSERSDVSCNRRFLASASAACTIS